MKKNIKRCNQGIWDESVPGIHFDQNGSSNYSKMFKEMELKYPQGTKGSYEFEKLVDKIKSISKNKQYDCLIGVSGGTDSSFLMHMAKKKYNLNPLAVTFDNGWASDTAVKNIKKLTSALNIDLETYVVNYEEMKDILKSYMKASLPWIDFPTDHAIKSILYKTAKREGIKYILIGHDFRSEGTQPYEWTYGDSKQLKFIQKRFGKEKIQSYPNISLFEQAYLSYIKNIKMIYPFFFLDYNKKNAQELLIKEYDWEYYGGHHHENIFTKYSIAYWMTKKHQIDKRLITFSAQIMSGEITRENALNKIYESPYDINLMERDKDYIIKKLDFTVEEYNKIWQNSNKSFKDYPSHFSAIEKIAFLIKPLMKFVLPQLPSFFFQVEARSKASKKT